MKATHIYHITTRQEWEAAKVAGEYEPAGYLQDGFIHCSSAEQVAPTAGRFFSGRKGLVVLEIDCRQLEGSIRWENAEEGSELFPHIHRRLPAGAVTRVLELGQGPNGEILFQP